MAAFTWADRRFALGKRWEAEEMGQPIIALMWRAKQLAADTEVFPDGFPFAARLAATDYYLGLADLAGAYPEELTQFGFGYAEALTILAALPEEYTPQVIYGDEAPLGCV